MGKIKEKIQSEEQLIKAQAEEKKKLTNNKVALSEEEIRSIREKLNQKHLELTQQYQKITHKAKIDSLTILRRKEFLEKQLDQVERDLKLMSKEIILVDLNK